MQATPGASSVIIGWTNNSGSHDADVVAQGSNVTVPTLSSGTHTVYPANAFGNAASQVGSTGWYCVINDNGTQANSGTVSGLTANTTYTIWVVDYSSASNPSYTQGGATNNPINVTTTNAAPTTQATNVTISNLASNAATLSWTNGNGASRAVFLLAGTTGTPTLTNGNTYTANTAFGSGTQAGTGWFCVFNGTGSTVNVTNLTANTGYRAMVVEYNSGTSPTTDYFTSTATGNPANFTSLIAPPTTQANTVAFSSTTSTGTSVSWANGNGAGRAVFMAAASSGTPSPVNGTSYTANTTFGSGTQIGSSGWFCIFNGTGSGPVAVSGLTGTAYRVMTLEWNGSAASPSFLTSTASGNPNNVTTLTPSVSVTNPSGGFNTTYGTASGNLGITVSGSNLASGGTVTCIFRL